MQIEDLVSNGMVRRWSFVDGFPKCIHDAIAPDSSGAVAALQANAAIRAILSDVEAYERAEAIVARGELEVERPSPMWDAYDAAVALIDGASETIRAFVLWRNGEPESESDRAAFVAARETAIAAFDAAKSAPLTVDPRPIPNVVTLFQGRTVMRQMPGPSPFPTLFDAVDAYVEAHKADKHALYDAWNYSNGFERNGALVQSLAPAFGITSAQLDSMFRAGASIKG